MSETIKVGIDLGASKTAVVSSAGRKAIIPTAVGRPKDSVSRRLFSGDAVVGRKLVSYPHALTIYRPLSYGQVKFVRAEEIRDEPEWAAECSEALGLILDNVLAEIGIGSETRLFCVIGVPARSSFEAQEFVVRAAERVCRSVIVVSEPFAVAYAIGQLSEAVIVDIGAGTIDICPMMGTYPSPEQQVTLSLGGDRIDELFLKAILKEHPSAICTLEQVREFKERHGNIDRDLDDVPMTLVIEGRPRVINVVNAMRTACETLVQPICEGIAEALSGWDHETQTRLLQNIILAGGGSRLIGLEVALMKALKKQEWLGTPRVSRVHDSQFIGASGALKLAEEMPEHQWEDFRLSEAA
jgi:rod shape-determining protein MreB and related proteins